MRRTWTYKHKSKNKDELIKIINNQKEQQQHNEFTIQNPKQETLSIYGIVILNSDCIIELNKLEDNNIDCILTLTASRIM